MKKVDIIYVLLFSCWQQQQQMGCYVELFPANQYKLLEPLSLTLPFSLCLSLSQIHCNAAQSTLHMAFTKAACTLVDLGLGAFVAKVCDLTHSFYYMDTYTQMYTFS